MAAKKTTRPVEKKAVPVTAKTESPAAVTAVRNTAIPKAATAAAKVITHDAIARRAYEISQSPQCGSEIENWMRAERELRGTR